MLSEINRDIILIAIELSRSEIGGTVTLSSALPDPYSSLCSYASQLPLDSLREV